ALQSALALGAPGWTAAAAGAARSLAAQSVLYLLRAPAFLHCVGGLNVDLGGCGPIFLRRVVPKYGGVLFSTAEGEVRSDAGRRSAWSANDSFGRCRQPRRLAKRKSGSWVDRSRRLAEGALERPDPTGRRRHCRLLSKRRHPCLATAEQRRD